MAYQPFLIAPFASGLDTDQDIWQLPQDAFSDIVNGHIYEGNIEKRNGYSLLGYMVHNPNVAVPATAITGITQANPAVVTIVGHSFVNGDQVLITNVSGMTELNQRIFTVANAGVNDFELNAEDSTTYTAYSGPSGRAMIYTGDRMMGIHRYIISDGTRQTLVFDTKRAAIYNGVTEVFDPLDMRDVFSSSDADYITGTGWQTSDNVTRFYFTNGVEFDGNPEATGLNGIRYYDAAISTTETKLFTQAAGDNPLLLGGTRILYGGKLLFTLKQRLLILNTWELDGGVTKNYPQRLRWCAAQNASNWDDVTAGGGGFVDAPTSEQIITAQSMQDSIIVLMTNSIWIIRPINDPALPYRWDKLNDFRAGDAKMGSVGFDRYVMSLGLRGLVVTDGQQSQRADTKIIDFINEEINIDNIYKVFMQRDFSKQRTWILYPPIEDSDCTGALIFDEQTNAFSKYSFDREVSSTQVDFNVLGYGTAAIDYTAADFIEANGKDWAAPDAGEEDTALSYYFSKDDELFLAGDRIGGISLMDSGANDYSTAVDFTLTSAGWNPYLTEGKEAQFGYIDIYASADQNAELLIEFFENDKITPYKSQAINLLPNLKEHSRVSDVIVNSDPSTGLVVYSSDHGISAGDTFYMYGIEGSSFFNDYEWLADTVTQNTISVATDVSSFLVGITGLTNTNPATVTASGHGFSNGDQVYIVDVGGTTEVNDLSFTVANATLNTFQLSGIDATGYGVYAGPSGYVFKKYLSGGGIYENRFFPTKVWKRAYAGGIGKLHQVRISENRKSSDWKILAMRPWFRPRGRRTLG